MSVGLVPVVDGGLAGAAAPGAVALVVVDLAVAGALAVGARPGTRPAGLGGVGGLPRGDDLAHRVRDPLGVGGRGVLALAGGAPVGVDLQVGVVAAEPVDRERLAIGVVGADHDPGRQVARRLGLASVAREEDVQALAGRDPPSGAAAARVPVGDRPAGRDALAHRLHHGVVVAPLGRVQPV